MPIEVVGSGAATGTFPIAATLVIQYEKVHLQIYGTFVAEVTFEGSNNLLDWVPVNLLKNGSSQFVTTKASGPAIFTGLITSKWVRVQITSYTSGLVLAHAVFAEANTVNTGPVTTTGPLDVNIIQVQGLAETPSDWTTLFTGIQTNTTPIPLFTGIPATPTPISVIQFGGTDGVDSRGVLTDTTGRLIIAPLTDTGGNASSVQTTPAPGSLQDVNITEIDGVAVDSATPGTMLVGLADGTGTPVTSTGAALDQNVKSWMGSITPTVGQKLKVASLPFALAIDQEQKIFGAAPQLVINSAPVAIATDDLHKIFGAGPQLTANSAPVVLPVDQAPIPVTQSGTWAITSTPGGQQDVNITEVQSVPQTGRDWSLDFLHLAPIDTSAATIATNTSTIPLATPIVGGPTVTFPNAFQISGTDGTNARIIKTLITGQPDIRPITQLDEITVFQGTTPWTINGTVTTTPALGTTQDINIIEVLGIPANAAAPGTLLVGISDGIGNALASSIVAPVGVERGLIVRNIPSGTQAVSGTVTANQGGSPWGIDLQRVNGTLQTGADWSTYLDDLPGIHTDTTAILVDTNHIPLWSKLPAASLVLSEVVMLGARDNLTGLAKAIVATTAGDMSVQPKALDTLVGTTLTFTGAGVITVNVLVATNRKTITVKCKRSNDGIVMLAGAYGIEAGDAQDIEVGPVVNGLITIPVTCASANPQTLYILEVGGAT